MAKANDQARGVFVWVRREEIHAVTCFSFCIGISTVCSHIGSFQLICFFYWCLFVNFRAVYCVWAKLSYSLLFETDAFVLSIKCTTYNVYDVGFFLNIFRLKGFKIFIILF